MTKSEYARSARKKSIEWELANIPYGYVMDGADFLARDDSANSEAERGARKKFKKKNNQKNGGEKSKTKW